MLVIACLCSYYLIRTELRDGTDEILQHEQINAEQLIHSSKILNNTVLFPDSLFTIKVVAFHANNSQYSDTTIYDKFEKNSVNYRVSKSFYNYNETTYLISILKPTLEENELMEGLISSLFLVISFLILSFLIVNWVLSKLLWKNFYNTIARLNEYELKKNKQLQLKTSNIKEFNELNEALTKMTNKIYADFLLQKEFTENASHEIQTPLAVIKSKLELLMQSENVKEQEMKQIQVIETSVNKLSSLNKALLLLVKIENHQFEETYELSLQKKLEKNLLYYKHLIDDKGIVIKTTFITELFLKMNDELCDILLTNLLQNAIRHNFKNGRITLSINKNMLTITNTGSPIQIKPNELFERFRKGTSKQESLGIGLAIVKGICDVYDIDINYIYENSEHTFKLNFPSN